VSTPIPTLKLAELNRDIKSRLDTVTFEAAATKGLGVFETLKEISKRTVRYVAEKNLVGKK